eukprot:gene1427-2742_t
MSSPIYPINSNEHCAINKSGPSPVSLNEFEILAKRNLPRMAFDYYASGANDMITLRENRIAYHRLRIQPRILVDAGHINMETSILGEKISFPICIAPTAMQCMAHPDGEIATSKAALRHNIVMTLSTVSTTPLEVVRSVAPSGLHWFQLYVFRDRSITLSLVQRAERAGFKALVLTVDTPILGRREADIGNKFSLPSHLTLGNFTSYDKSHSTGPKDNASSTTDDSNSGSQLAKFFANLIDQRLTWEVVAWLRENTTMRIVVKGVITARDAEECIQHGVDAIWISNHGARQLDTVPATIEVLSEICDVVAGRVEVYVDGGIMRGTDVFKALALGARAVFLGRPVIWGLSHGGESGVFDVLGLLKEELELCMRLTGCPSIL